MAFRRLWPTRIVMLMVLERSECGVGALSARPRPL